MQAPICFCGITAKKFQCKNSAIPDNIGRMFYACSKAQDDGERCKYFEWEENSKNEEVIKKIDEIVEAIEVLKNEIKKTVNMLEEMNVGANKNKKRKI
jgi:phosphoribosylaminoimidazole-succinocarboxamide synthase